ncbi:hypothetical protein ACM66B_002545 [Microbotryomycetes sp. NB124-2]
MAKSKHPKQARRTTTITPASTTTTLVRFSRSTTAVGSAAPSGLYYAHLVRAPDGHTVRVYDCDSNKCVQRWSGHAQTNDEGDSDQQVNAIHWALVNTLSKQQGSDSAAQDAQSSRGKKRRKSDAAAAATTSSSSSSIEPAKVTPASKLVLCLGLDNGSILVLSPTDGATAKTTTLSHPTATSPVTALAAPADSTLNHLWSAHEDGTCRVWDLRTRQLVARSNGIAQGKKIDDLAVQYSTTSASDDNGKVHASIIASHLSLSVYSTSFSASLNGKDKVKDLKTLERGKCPGHVDKAFVQWTATGPSSQQPNNTLQFLSYSQSDRFVQLWSLSEGRQDATLQARLSLDSGVQAVATDATGQQQVVAAVDAAGKLSIADLALDSSSSSSLTSPGKGSKVESLTTKTEVVGPEDAPAGIVSVSLGHQIGQVVVSRGSVKPSFEAITYFDEQEGVWTPKLELGKATNLLIADAEDNVGAAAPQRYTEKSASTARPDAVAEATSDDDEIMANTGELDVDMAEPTLAERLKAMNVSKEANKKKALAADQGSDDDDDDESDEDSEEDDDEMTGQGRTVVPATTLTTTLIQALHSSDAPLLESCLTHSSPNLIRSTVKRLPPGSLVLNLLEQLVERLGKGRRGVKSLEAASVKRSRALIEWVKQVLVVHVGFLVTVPSLVTRLASLHASLTRRLALEPTLLALNGRLDLVVSQIDVKRDNVRRRIELSEKRQTVGARKGTKYVEGESDDDDDDEEEDEEDVDRDVDMDDEDDLDDSEVEDVLLASQDEQDEVDEDDGFGFDDDDDDDDEEEDAEAGGSRAVRKAKVNGNAGKAGGIKMGVRDLLDLEAEDEDEDDDEQDDSDDDDEEEDEEDDEAESEDDESD